jgi:DNA-binding HxlR family transcriptional regulator
VGSHALCSTLPREDVGEALKPLEGRWNLVALFYLFGIRDLRFSDPERAIPVASQKMLTSSFGKWGKTTSSTA